jgi:hypothetical protein
MRILDEEEVLEFVKNCEEAEKDVNNRQMLLDQIYDDFEYGLFLLGTTVVEDRL